MASLHPAMAMLTVHVAFNRFNSHALGGGGDGVIGGLCLAVSWLAGDQFDVLLDSSWAQAEMVKQYAPDLTQKQVQLNCSTVFGHSVLVWYFCGWLFLLHLFWAAGRLLC